MGRHKPSYYNVSHVDGETTLLANTMSGGVIRLDSQSACVAGNLLSGRVPKNSRERELNSLLIANGFLVPEDLDELRVLHERHWAARNGIETLSVGVAVTQACNFACHYCFQDHVPRHLSDSTGRGLVKYVQRNLAGRKLLDLVWFGGEPLLRVHVIEQLSREFMRICQNKEVTYQAAVVTNGYLLNRETVYRLCQAGVNAAQITLDGPASIHDKRRHLKGGGATFDQILENLMVSASLICHLYLRVNIDRRNVDYMDELIDALGPIRDQIVLCFRAATSPTSHDGSESWCLTGQEWFERETVIVGRAREQGFRVAVGFTIPGTSYCAAYQRNAISVDAFGDVHLCPVSVGRREDRLGSLDSNGTISKRGGPQAAWDQFDPFDDPECCACTALPVCMGSCLWYIDKPKSESIRCAAKVNLAQKVALEPYLTGYREEISRIQVISSILE